MNLVNQHHYKTHDFTLKKCIVLIIYINSTIFLRRRLCGRIKAFNHTDIILIWYALMCGAAYWEMCLWNNPDGNSVWFVIIQSPNPRNLCLARLRTNTHPRVTTSRDKELTSGNSTKTWISTGYDYCFNLKNALDSKLHLYQKSYVFLGNQHRQQ